MYTRVASNSDLPAKRLAPLLAVVVADSHLPFPVAKRHFTRFFLPEDLTNKESNTSEQSGFISVPESQ